MTTIRYWAAARAAAGTREEGVEAATLAEALGELRARHDERLSAVLEVCSFIVDGAPVGARNHGDVSLGGVALVDVLPPFAGG